MGDGVALSSPLGPLAQPVSLELGAKRVEMLLVLPSESDLPLLLLGTKVGEHCSGVVRPADLPAQLPTVTVAWYHQRLEQQQR